MGARMATGFGELEAILDSHRRHARTRRAPAHGWRPNEWGYFTVSPCPEFVFPRFSVRYRVFDWSRDA